MQEIEAEKLWDSPLVTQLEPAAEFFPAENYHQDYYKRNTQQPYCMFVVRPKVQKFRSKFAEKMRSS